MSETSIQNVFSDHRVFEVKARGEGAPLLPDLEAYRRLYHASIEDPEKFWGGIAEGFEWFQKWVFSGDYTWEVAPGDPPALPAPPIPSSTGRE